MDNKTLEYSEKVWEENRLPPDLLMSNSHEPSIFIYNIAEDTKIALQAHIARIDTLRQQKDTVIVNVAKGKWSEVYRALNLDSLFEREGSIYGEKPSNRRKTVFFMCGGVVFALLTLIYYKFFRYGLFVPVE